jgi:NAD(P)-dependent dehydrogenase (short-subunit alcohol dehydrogenase family)
VIGQFFELASSAERGFSVREYPFWSIHVALNAWPCCPRPGVAHGVHLADLTQVAEMKRVAGQIAAEEPHIDVLINNAGALFGTWRLTPDGLERTFALNHMSYFVITQLLRERIVASAPARIVSTASGTHEGAVLDLDDLQSEKRYSATKAYSCSKLCNILFTRELARRLKNTGVTANCLHPTASVAHIGLVAPSMVPDVIDQLKRAG